MSSYRTGSRYTEGMSAHRLIFVNRSSSFCTWARRDFLTGDSAMGKRMRFKDAMVKLSILILRTSNRIYFVTGARWMAAKKVQQQH